MIRKCKICDCELTSENESRNGYTKYGKVALRKECKNCRSKKVSADNKKPQIASKRRTYINQWKRDKGIVKQYPCLTCNMPCYKVYAKAFCSIKCRFMSYVDTSTDCWIWKGSKNRRGYGKIMINNKLVVASRASYELFIGKIDEDKFICHACDNPSCVNWKHLWQGTNSDNQQDSLKKGRHRWSKKIN